MRRMKALLFLCLLLLTLPSSCALAQRAAATAETPLTPVENLVDADGNVVFNDAMAEQAIRANLGIPEGPVASGKMSKVGSKRDLSIGNGPTVETDLSVLQLCTKVKVLRLEGAQPKDWSALSACASLNRFYTNGVSVPNLDFLAGMKKLQFIWIYNSDCGDISALATLPKLRAFMCNKSIDDLTPLYACKKIENIGLGFLSDDSLAAVLEVFGNRLINLNLANCALSEMNFTRILSLKLKSLDFDSIKCESPERIWSQMTKLETLSLSNMSIPSLAGIAGMKKLQYLAVNNLAGLTDLSELYGLVKLRTLEIVNLKISDLTGIENMKGLTNLTLMNMPIRLDLTPVFSLTKLTSLHLNRIETSSILGIKALGKLQTLELRGVSGVTDYTELLSLKKLQNVDTDQPNLMPEGVPVS